MADDPEKHRQEKYGDERVCTHRKGFNSISIGHTDKALVEIVGGYLALEVVDLKTPQDVEACAGLRIDGGRGVPAEPQELTPSLYLCRA